MAYTAGNFDNPHLYVQWGGKLPGNEQWSCGLRLRNKTGTAFVYAESQHTAVTNAIKTYHASNSSQISAAAKLSFVKMNLINVDGHYAEATTHEQIVADLAGSGATPSIYPNQIALAVSLVTGFSRGPAHRGRFYMPLPAFPVDAAGLISDEHRDFAVTAATTLLTSLNAASANWEVAVFSRKQGAAGNRKVTGIEIGRVLDTQRRRRRSLAEGYAS
jgi:hypothetical protein